MDNLLTHPWFKLNQLNSFMALFIGLFSLLTLIYSAKFMRAKPQRLQYYIYIIMTALTSLGVVFSNNLILLLVFWGFLGLTLYLLIIMGDNDSWLVAKKALIIVGGSDALMILGFSIIYYFSGTLQMDKITLSLNNGWLILAYICIAIGCFAKAGAMPFHSWIPDCAKSAPLPVSAYLPAALDKILGIYLLVYLCLNLFVMNQAMNNFLMFIGAFTIIAAVMMALVQHNLKRLLGYHAVSQVGYMILGIGTGNPIGIAGGIFHMINNTIYKSCLFFDAGNIETVTGTSELNNLGGLAKFMPLTYISCLIASFSISGIPPFNGFVSKWLIYQGLILRIAENSSPLQLFFSVLCLAAALFGSVLTLASFVKILHAVFLGQRNAATKNTSKKEVSFTMWLPCMVLAALCVVFGVFAFSLPLKYFIFPVVARYQFIDTSALTGFWSPSLSSLLIILGLFLGLIIFKFNKFKSSLRQDNVACGGEIAEQKEENMVTGTEFYNTVKEIGFLGKVYKMAEDGAFDIYEQAKKLLFITKPFQYLHNGILPTYLVWVLLGMLGLFIVFMR